MSWSASIRVVDEDGNPRDGVEVTLFFDGLIGSYEEEYTDDDGWAEFEIEHGNDERNIKSIYIDGDMVAEPGYVSDGFSASFTKE